MILPVVLSLLALGATNTVSGSLYATKPTADTIYRAGHNVSVTWIDDGLKPHISNMGKFIIDLYARNGPYDEHVMTLAKNVSPLSKSHRVYIPHSLGTNRSDYTLRFICKDPLLTVYTADFTISDGRPPISTRSLELDSATPTLTTPHLPVAPTSNMQPFFLTLVMPDLTLVSQLPPRPTPTPVTTFYAGQEQEDQGSDSSSRLGPAKSRPTSASWSRFAVLDIEKIKFRIVFILWPALMGITMAI
ncbi:hypothetical protein GLOTRDRAFT_132798 [Gloeophyllum trabeum ATCC 11539]|uniref:Yeast cell wall synthesis Kre9/Knh1-like N-terminal domain-containing protein n=1 Tax=Gloeophyllum trabeum (strain ATCC 11539 / FP-39264 / Madison 617) TaxID=670483 RepID=S7RFX7_GLOTA|nr:uncharacterized protein GLOTRDRAFT_132798 [Gloeophyllum trabeum ATCC 11539]EPQ51424.1 hypothetical protein GLOTRDRAFT_132798 [Gloeophyllum trabeum ATCC 11539]